MKKDEHQMTKEYRSIAPLLITSLAITLVLAGLLARWPGAVYAAPPRQTPDASPSVLEGRGLWAENCQPCHGRTGRGDGPTAASIPDPLPDLSAPATGRQSVPVDYFDVIKNGRMDRMMPPWGNRLNDADIWDAVAYVWSLSISQPELSAGETIYQSKCAECHGQNGQGETQEVRTNQVDFSDLEAMVRRSQVDLQGGFSNAGGHDELVNSLSEEELWQALAYVRTFSFDVSLPQRDGVLSGQVLNGTTSEPIGNIEVTLHIFEGNTEIETLTTQADSSGQYTFENLLTEHTILYLVEGAYQDIAYVSEEPGIFAPDSTETTLNLTVYEPTSNADAITITQLHYLLAFTPEAINAVQIFVVGNESDQTYVGESGQTFPFSIPDEATAVTFQNDQTGTRFIKSEQGYVDTAPIVPGEEGSSIVVSYNIPYDNDSLTINLPLPFDTDDLNILLSEQGASLSSEQVEFIETRQVQGSEYSIFNGSGLTKGDALTLKLSGLDSLDFDSAAVGPVGAMVAAPPANQDLLRWVVLGLGGLAIVGVAIAYPLLRPQLTHQRDGLDDEPELYRQKLVLMLARLDEAFEAGDLDEEVYRQARTRYKDQLAQVIEI